MPALAALVGASLAAATDGGRSGANASVRVVALATGALLLVAGAGVMALFVAPGRYPLAGLGTVTVAAGVGGLAVIAFAATRRLHHAALALGACFVVAAWIFVTATLPDFERYKPVRPLAETITRTASATAVIGSYRLGIPSLVYYLRRPIVESYAPQQVTELFGSDADVYVVMADRDYQDIRDTLPVRTYVVDRRQWIDARAGRTPRRPRVSGVASGVGTGSREPRTSDGASPFWSHAAAAGRLSDSLQPLRGSGYRRAEPAGPARPIPADDDLPPVRACLDEPAAA